MPVENNQRDYEDLIVAATLASINSYALYPERLLELLTHYCRLDVASVYLVTADGSTLQRRAFKGDRRAPPLELRRTSPVVRQVLGDATPRTSVSDCTLVVPMRLEAPDAITYRGVRSDKQTMGALWLEARSPQAADAIAECLRTHERLMAKLYLAAVDRRAMELRRMVVERVAYRRDIGSMAHNYLTMVKQELGFEGAALWVLDARRGLLHRRRALRSRRAEAGHAPFLREDDDSYVAACFRSCKPVWHDSTNPLLRESDLDLAYESDLSNWGALPVRLPADAKLAGRSVSAAGVIEFVNHYVESRGHRALASLSWEDQYLADFTCELLSVLIYQILRTQDHEAEFERRLHGAKTALQAARSRLQIVERYHVERYMPPRMLHYIPNAIDWLQDLESQINREDLVGRTSANLSEVSLYGDVLAKLEGMVRAINSRDSGRMLELSGLDDLANVFRTIPKVKGNRHALDCVFRNLLDNSRKYCQPPDGSNPQVRIRVLMPEDGAAVVICVSDNGKPIPADEAEHIFADGYRGISAQSAEPEGLGQGLFDCKRLVEAMGGSISVSSSDMGVAFRVELKSAGDRR
jgi:signal transduction histidine kinase